MALSSKWRIAATSVAALCWIVWGVGAPRQVSAAGDHCFYRNTMYSDGAAACQSGTEFRCDDGEWRSKGKTCATEEPHPSRSRQFEGISFSTGSASCQAGSQFRCEDGAWRSLGVSCPIGDSPIRVIPSGRTCMFDGATVSNGSTVCRSGTTYLCSDGEWTNLGTLCR